MSDRPCTCHPDDNPPVPCPQKFALSECKTAALRKDAERYRWLRVQGHKDIAACWLLPRPYPEPLEITNPEDFDAAIDAAIRSTQEQHRG